ncbi:unnamed protein product [Penicillium salamii]|uniref:Uncharacterized protein n=1 Tax=Penicillium salamii TaxID=1612424 RepID=A0A9W4JB11_9EURO|nr:unnamed protein product [Penicillium salamii]CAG8231031.1 unnamed protein product [Penicillium salamii]CAG8235876.1 unnamed protein product [Penicillium salamii]CAG8257091.1 unnamed protein product [Penicillium salamii]CAG8347325.1 unnamed protein product [Penicillium salamii]
MLTSHHFKFFIVIVIYAVYLRLRHDIVCVNALTCFVLCAAWALSELVLRLFLYPRFLTPLKHVPTPKIRHWLTGNMKSYFIELQDGMMQHWIRTVPNKGLIRLYIVGNFEWLFPTNVEALMEILVKKSYDFEKPEFIEHVLKQNIGDGLVLAKGDVHKAQRKILLPAFSSRQIQNLRSVFWSKGVQMAKMIDKHLSSRDTSNNSIQISEWSDRVTLDIIGKAGMGVEFRSLETPGNALTQAYHKLAMPSASEKLLIVLCVALSCPKLIYKFPTKRNREINEARQIVRDAARSVIEQGKTNKSSLEEPQNILSVAMHNGSFSDEGLVDQAMNFLSAGHETVSSAFQWSVYALCKHQDIQLRLREEIRANLPPLSAEPTQNHDLSLKNLPYLNAFCSEVLRFYPPIPKIARRAVRDTSIAGEFIPKGSHVVISPRIMNRMPELWGSNASDFNPDRFMASGTPTEDNTFSNQSFMTFLHGPRSCIAQGFAKAELAFLVASITGRFHMELQCPDAELQITEATTMVPSDGVMARFTPLDGW